MAGLDDASSSLPSDSDEFSHSDFNSDSESESVLSSDDRDELGARPYMYEPEHDGDSDDSIDSDSSDDERQARIGNNNWCTCDECHPMVSARESECCREVAAVKNMTDSFVLDLECITEHPGFRSVCLDRWVLDTAYRQYRQQYGGQGHESTQNKKYRHVAYRQLARWCWGYLGRNVRVVLPACAVTRIRETFPSEDGQYTGFNEVVDE